MSLSRSAHRRQGAIDHIAIGMGARLEAREVSGVDHLLNERVIFVLAEVSRCQQVTTAISDMSDRSTSPTSIVPYGRAQPRSCGFAAA